MENNSLTYFTNELLLRQSELFGGDYENFDHQQIDTFNDVNFSNLEDWQNSILQKNLFLNDLQIINIGRLFASLTEVLKTINPDKLNINNDSLIEENELLLWRETSKGISKLFFNKFGEIIYAFNGNDGTKKRGVFQEDVDFEKLLYRFLSL